MPGTVLETGLGSPYGLRGDGIALSGSGAAIASGNIVDAAIERTRTQGWAYAKAEAPTSPYSNLTGNRNPGVTRPAWLRGQNKCNQFVGDVLISAGLKMPTYRMHDGSEHYMTAEDLPKQGAYFDRVSGLDAIRPGDLLVLDYGQRSGASGAHTEIILGYDSRHKALRVAGAHEKGAFISNFKFAPSDWFYNANDGSWTRGGNRLYFLRPKSWLVRDNRFNRDISPDI